MALILATEQDLVANAAGIGKDSRIDDVTGAGLWGI